MNKPLKSLSWKDVAYCHGYLGHISAIQNAAEVLGYTWFCWNGRIYLTENCADSGLTMESVE